MQKNQLAVFIPSGPPVELVFVQGVEFLIGDDNGEYDDEKPAHRVKLADFYIGKYPVTQDVWQVVMGKNPSRFKGERRPVEQVSWDAAQDFLGRLRQLTGKDFRLPTEAEWEYAARGGRYSQGYKYAGSDRAKQVAWHDANSDNETHEVGLLLENELGLLDMSGNVWEWCSDWFSGDYYAQCHQRGVVDNPQGPDSGGSRVLRGGSSFHFPLFCRAVDRRQPAGLSGRRHRLPPRSPLSVRRRAEPAFPVSKKEKRDRRKAGAEQAANRFKRRRCCCPRQAP